MTHLTCPSCGSNDHTSGYGLAAGPMGSYTFCNHCHELIEFVPDLDGLPPEVIGHVRRFVVEWRAKVWGDSPERDYEEPTHGNEII